MNQCGLTKKQKESWKIDDCPDSNGFATIRPSDRTLNGDTKARPIATVYDDGEQIVNARLIAAAPDLLAELTKTNLFLIHVVSSLARYAPKDSPVQVLLDGHIEQNAVAIARAEGRAE